MQIVREKHRAREEGRWYKPSFLSKVIVWQLLGQFLLEENVPINRVSRLQNFNNQVFMYKKKEISMLFIVL